MQIEIVYIVFIIYDYDSSWASHSTARREPYRGIYPLCGRTFGSGAEDETLYTRSERDMIPVVMAMSEIENGAKAKREDVEAG